MSGDPRKSVLVNQNDRFLTFWRSGRTTTRTARPESPKTLSVLAEREQNKSRYRSVVLPRAFLRRPGNRTAGAFERINRDSEPKPGARITSPARNISRRVAAGG